MPDFSFPPLPIIAVLPEALKVLLHKNKLVLEAPPGAGKTTIFPLALLKNSLKENKKILVLEPRRLAARAAANRMAQILNEPIGQTVGYRVRLENKISAATRIEVVTEGILIRMIQEDPALENIAAILFDEFHERSLQADLGLALALDAQEVLRPDLKIVIMSATLDAVKIGEWLDAPVVRSEGVHFEVKTEYLKPSEITPAEVRPVERVTSLVPKAILKALKSIPEGDILVFLPGMTEIRKVAQIIENYLPAEIDLHLLHGDLSLARQQAAIDPAGFGRRKVVLSTSIAETSLTLEGVQVVIDSGYSRVPGFIPRTGLTSLLTVPVSKASANQRRGRAGRLGPGTCFRLWSLAEDQQLLEHLKPEILEADLSSLKLELALWGNQDVYKLRWLNPPPAAALAQAQDLLVKIKAISPSGQPTAHGKEVAALGIEPRLGHLVIRGKKIGFGNTACTLAALLTERDFIKRKFFKLSPTDDSTFVDIRKRLNLLHNPDLVDGSYDLDKNIIKRINQQAENLRQRINIKKEPIDPDAAGILLAIAYPDRMAKLEAPGQVRLISGQMVSLETEIFGNAEYYSIAQLNHNSKRALLASNLDKKDFVDLYNDDFEELEEKFVDEGSGRVVARKIKRLGSLIIENFPIKSIKQEDISEIFFEYIKSKGISILSWDSASKNLKERLIFLHRHFPENWKNYSDDVLTSTMEEWLYPHLTGVKSLEDLSKLNMTGILLSNLSWQKQQELEKLAPTHISVPSGSKISLDYSDPESPVLAVRLQEIFGLTETPRIAGGKVKVLLHLLSPAFRPVQVTQDLNSFWKAGYYEVRKDLRGRYPKHAWPEDPLNAVAIRGAKKRKT